MPTSSRSIGRRRLTTGVRRTLVVALGTVPLLAIASLISVPSAAWAASSGVLDPSFAGDGSAVVDFATTDESTAVAVQPDGKVLIAGHASSSSSLFSGPLDTLLARFNRDGTLDGTFGAGGKVIVDLSDSGMDDNFTDEALAVAVQPDGKIVTAGRTVDASFFGSHIEVARFRRDGTPDTTFGNGGHTVVDIGLYDFATGVALQPDGKVVVAGVTRNADSGYDDTVVARFTRDGKPDRTLAGDGIAIVDVGQEDYAHAVTVQPGGAILVAGEATGPTGYQDTSVVKFRSDGELDRTFAHGGIALADIAGGADDVANALVLQPDGRIVTAGALDDGKEAAGSINIAVARFTRRGDLDRSFARDGSTSLDLGGFEAAYGVALQRNGRIVVAGVRDSDTAVAQFRSNGRLDPNFADDGSFVLDLGGFDGAAGVAVQADGRIVTAGYANYRPGDTAVLRLLAGRG